MLLRIDMPTRLMDSTLEDLFEMPRRSTPAVDVAEYDERTVVVAELPGVRKEDVQLTFTKDVLTITGERKPLEIPQNAKILVHEQHVRSFERSVRIGHAVDTEAISASMEQGMLTVVLPKAAVARPRTITVK